MNKTQIRREDVPPGACLCDFCIGKCCRYFSLPVHTPTRWSDYQEIEKYLDYGNTLVYVEEGTWFLVVMTLCKYLTKENKCAVYWTRPKVCREYTTDDCEYDSDWKFDKVFETPAQIREYAEAILPPRKSTRGMNAQLPSEEELPAERGFTVRLDPPTTWDDYDAMRWYLAHDETRVFVGRWGWFLLVQPRRGKKSGANLSLVSDPGKVFESAEQLWEYAEAVLPPRRRPREIDTGLPIVTIG
ncbi:YkgJ family cysteine cluster protein [Singulisphaera sp. PoT]|uniref:YkgJ family cysteine cluster protein n=1 Tax=Singulisphaera sp. PoT TaxID=3411797 RepID=UPI003BF60E25